MTKGVSLSIRSRRGVANAASFIIAMPIWYVALGLLIVFAWWFWSLAVNFVGVAQGAQAGGLGRNAEERRLSVIAAGLGGFAADYRDAARYSFGPRSIGLSVERVNPINALPAPGSTTVRARSIARIEDFYGRPPAGNDWE